MVFALFQGHNEYQSKQPDVCKVQWPAPWVVGHIRTYSQHCVMFHFALRVSEEASLYDGYCPEEDAGVAEQIQYCLCNEGADISCSSDAYILDCSIKDANQPNAVIKRCECSQKPHPDITVLVDWA